MYVAFCIGLVVGLGAGFLAGHQFVSKSISGLKQAKASFEKKLSVIASEVEAIEQQADRRIVPAIHKVTARIRGLL